MSAIDSDELIWWVHVTVLPLWERSTRGVAWCPRWWEHAEAVFRLEMVRRAWEDAVGSDDATALSNWMLHVVGPHMAELTAPSGPFSDCGWNERRGYAQPHQPKGLPFEWPEDFAFDDERFPVNRATE